MNLLAQHELISALNEEIEYLRDNSAASANDPTDAWELRAKISSLKKSVLVERALVREADTSRRQQK